MCKKQRANSQTLQALIVTMLLASTVGCGTGLEPEYQKLGLVDISGTVTLDSKPLSGVTVVFEESQFVYSSGVTDANGRYQLMFDSRKSGIVPGEKTVRIRPGSPQKEGGPEESDPDAKPAKSDSLVPDCYNKSSTIKVNVTASDSQLNFALKSDCS
jgi:hypothetical protein